jgi:hypothetical protein
VAFNDPLDTQQPHSSLILPVAAVLAIGVALAHATAPKQRARR